MNTMNKCVKTGAMLHLHQYNADVRCDAYRLGDYYIFFAPRPMKECFIYVKDPHYPVLRDYIIHNVDAGKMIGSVIMIHKDHVVEEKH